jgi:hypothetical protein
MAYTQQAPDLGIGPALGLHLAHLLYLEAVELLRAAHVDAIGLGPLPAFSGSGQDQGSFEFGNATENGNQQLAVRRGGVCPCIRQRAESCAGLCDLVEGAEQVEGGSRQPVAIAVVFVWSKIGTFWTPAFKRRGRLATALLPRLGLRLLVDWDDLTGLTAGRLQGPGLGVDKLSLGQFPCLQNVE